MRLAKDDVPCVLENVVVASRGGRLAVLSAWADLGDKPERALPESFWPLQYPFSSNHELCAADRVQALVRLADLREVLVYVGSDLDFRAMLPFLLTSNTCNKNISMLEP